jgi:hypothetical protein
MNWNRPAAPRGEVACGSNPLAMAQSQSRSSGSSASRAPGEHPLYFAIG